MSRTKSILSTCIFCMFLLGCVDPFEVPSSISNIGILVVEGRIGDQETNIRLSRTANLDSFRVKPEVNAIVQIENELGMAVGQLDEVEAGTYFLNLGLTIDEKYRIRIETNNQEIYYSEYMTLALTPSISSLDVRIDTSNFSLEVLLSTEDPDNNTKYYLWDYVETYEYSARFTSIVEFDGEKLIPRSEENQITICWQTESSTDILLQSSVQFERDIISNKRIVNYSLDETQKFTRTYSILVNQYALSSDEYEFWSLLEKNTEALGTLFDPQPSQISSNLECTSDPQKRVIGYVGSSSRAQMRIFVENEEIPKVPETTLTFCEAPELILSQEALDRIFSDDNNIPLAEPPQGDFPGFSYTTRYCGDCRVQGGTTVKPSFWF